MAWEALFWSIFGLFLAIIAVAAFASHASPIGFVFVLLTLMAFGYLLVRRREFKKGKRPEEAPTTESSGDE